MTECPTWESVFFTSHLQSGKGRSIMWFTRRLRTRARDLRKASYGYLRFPGVGCAAQKGGETQQNRAARQAVDCSAGCVHLTRLKSALKPAAYTSSQTVTLTAVQHHLHLHPHHPWVRAHTCTSTCSTHSPAARRLQQQRRSHPPFPLYPSQPCSLTISGMVLSSR